LLYPTFSYSLLYPTFSYSLLYPTFSYSLLYPTFTSFILIVCGGKDVLTKWICCLEATAWTLLETWHKTPPVRDVFVHFSHLFIYFHIVGMKSTSHTACRGFLGPPSPHKTSKCISECGLSIVTYWSRICFVSYCCGNTNLVCLITVATWIYSYLFYINFKLSTQKHKIQVSFFVTKV
jgi:hypothetical protein